ncbi:MAG TPA: TRAP transporter substrate-binding protein [Xanthobacteraceae bacterium]|nr:TRAP transporter substrate-binding protein [Xanthobacteraceae bacterium]
MRVARRTFLASITASVAAPAVMRVAFADAPQFSLKLHHAFSSVSSAHDKFLAPWARQVEAQSGGRIRIDLFPSMQLGGAPADLFDQARDGVADLTWAQPSNTPGRFPKIEAFELPFVPSRRALVSSKAVDDYARANLVDEFREVHPICFSCSDRGVLHTNRPIHTIEEIRDQRLHVQTRFALEAMHWLGAVAVPMPSAQLPLAIAQHVVDGCVDPWNMVPTFKLNDLLKTHTEFSDSSLSTTTFVLAMNKAAYDKLPRDLKTVIDNNSGQPAASIAGAMWDVQAAAVVDMVSGRGDPITTLLPEAVAHWRKATEPVVDGWLKDMKEHKVDGGKLLANARALLAKYAGEPEPQPAQPTRPSQQPAEAKADATTPPKAEATSSTPTPSTPTPPKPAVKPTVSAATPATQPTPVPAATAPSPAPAVKPTAPIAQPAPATASVTPAPSPAPAAPPVATPAPPPPPAPVASSPPVAPPTPPVAAAPVPVHPLPPKTLDIPL